MDFEETLVICEKDCGEDCGECSELYHWEVKRSDLIEQYNDNKLYLQLDLTEHEFRVLTLINLAEKMKGLKQ